MAPPLLAQHNCPPGFDYAGALRGAGSGGIAFDERREVNLPPYATIDMSFQQSKVRAHAGNGQAQSDLHAKDIPKGIYIITGGSTIYDNGWAVSAPELKTVGEPAQYQVRNEALLYFEFFTSHHARRWLRRERVRLLQAEELKRGGNFHVRLIPSHRQYGSHAEGGKPCLSMYEIGSTAPSPPPP